MKNIFKGLRKSLAGTTFSVDALSDGLYVEITTNLGVMIGQLYFDKVPMTVANFVGLAEGTLGPSKGTPFYEGVIFHRVIKDFMIQGGDPDGTGRGGPGYSFPDEIDESLKHTDPGIFSMANAGPNTNGSQFFIIHKATPMLDGKHAVFGKLISGLDILEAIATTKIGVRDRPVDNIVMETVRIIRVGQKAEAFTVDQASFDAMLAGSKDKSELARAAAETEYIKKFKQKWPNTVTTDSTLIYAVTKAGSGSKPAKGQTVTAHYHGTLANGKKFDSSIERDQPFEFQVGMGQVIKGWDEAFLDMTKGEKRTLIIPFSLAYGESGRPPKIPPRARLIFDVELIDFK